MASAIVWATYSVLSRRFAGVPTTVVTGYCALTAIGATAGHLLVEQTVWPQSNSTWLAILAQGIGPVGLAFYLWDRGMKFGSLRFLGAASYSAPLLSSLLLIAFGLAHASSTTWISAGLITAGAALSGLEIFSGRRSDRRPGD
jgi:drug/metabolite transporter (DMT)-like permease